MDRLRGPGDPPGEIYRARWRESTPVSPWPWLASASGDPCKSGSRLEIPGIIKILVPENSIHGKGAG